MDSTFHIVTEDQCTVVLHHIGVVMVTDMLGDGICEHPGSGGGVRDDVHTATQETGLRVEQGAGHGVRRGEETVPRLVRRLQPVLLKFEVE